MNVDLVNRREEMGLPFWLLCAAVLVVTAFLLLLSTYGDFWLVPWHDEVVIARLAQNLTEGRGFRNDFLDDLLPSADERTYWQMPVYPFALSIWGKFFGFELNSLRWFSRICGAVTITLLFALTVKLRLSATAILLSVLWTATDLTFQFASNFVRPDILTCSLLLAATLFLVHKPLTSWHCLLAGLSVALSVFSHPIALPCWLVCGAIIVKRNGWRDGAIFVLPFLIGFSAWLFYGLQDWHAFTGQLKAHALHKSYPIPHRLAFLLGTTFWGIQHYLGIPLNAMPWCAVILAFVWVSWREKGRMFLPRWLVLFAAALYAIVAVGAEAWYPALFVPFGYLILAAMVWLMTEKATTKTVKALLMVAALGWWVYQARVVFLHVSALPEIRRQTMSFVRDLERRLPERAVVLIGSFSPDPTFALLNSRSDLKFYQLMPSPMVDPVALKKLRNRLTHLLVLEEAVKEPLLSGQKLRSWHFDFGGLTQPPHRGVTIVLLKVPKVSQQPSNSKPTG